jgi:hypothetical protein
VVEFRDEDDVVPKSDVPVEEEIGEYPVPEVAVEL